MTSVSLWMVSSQHQEAGENHRLSKDSDPAQLRQRPRVFSCYVNLKLLKLSVSVLDH